MLRALGVQLGDEGGVARGAPQVADRVDALQDGVVEGGALAVDGGELVALLGDVVVEGEDGSGEVEG